MFREAIAGPYCIDAFLFSGARTSRYQHADYLASQSDACSTLPFLSHRLHAGMVCLDVSAKSP